MGSMYLTNRNYRNRKLPKVGSGEASEVNKVHEITRKGRIEQEKRRNGGRQEGRHEVCLFDIRKSADDFFSLRSSVSLVQSRFLHSLSKRLPQFLVQERPAVHCWVIGDPAECDIIPPNEAADRRISE